MSYHCVMFEVTINDKKQLVVRTEKRDADYPVSAWTSPGAAIDYFERSNARALELGAGYSAGAMLFHIFFKPRVFSVEDLDEVKRLVEDADGKIHAVSMNHISAWECGLVCQNEELAKETYEKGIVPSLVPQRQSAKQPGLPGI
jgi:hypothetical protein